MKKSICFAYYADGKFLGWYGDSFGSVSKCPKVYSSLEKMRDIVKKNFSAKIKIINSSTFDEEKEKTTNIVEAIPLLIFSNEDSLRGKEIELRAVECPEYDGPNPEFDGDAYEKTLKDYKKKMTAAGIFDIPARSKERIEAIEKFELETPRPKCNNWIYANFAKVREWAKNEPSEFIEIFKPE